MPKISQEELLKIAHISHISVLPDELNALQEQLENVLTYAECISQKSIGMYGTAECAEYNVFRSDVVKQYASNLLSAPSASHAEGYFVVPRVIDQK